MYYKAKKLATSNGRVFHIAAILLRKGDVVKIGENTTKTHPRFKRYYNDGSSAACMHPEMNVLRFPKPGDVIETGPSSAIIFAIEGRAMIVRAN